MGIMTHPTRPTAVVTLRAAEACFLVGEDARAEALANLACTIAKREQDAVTAAEAASLRHKVRTILLAASHAGWPSR